MHLRARISSAAFSYIDKVFCAYRLFGFAPFEAVTVSGEQHSHGHANDVEGDVEVVNEGQEVLTQKVS
jgi:hypothetical protein